MSDTQIARILVVDDEKNIRLTLSHTLKGEGYAVDTAVNGADALKHLEEGAFDLMLLDLRMPDMDGSDVLREVAQTRPETRIVIITAHGTVENAVEALKLGAVDFIQKPFSPQEIRDLVQRVLARPALPHEPAAVDYATALELAKRAVNERRFAAAERYVKQAIAEDLSRPEAFNLLGILQELRGDHTSAMRNYRIALDLDPAYAAARKNLMRSPDSARPSADHFSID